MYTPWTSRSIGIEMETAATRRSGVGVAGGTIQSGLIDANVPNVNRRAVGWYNSDGRTWDVKTDSSAGYEVCSPAIRLDAAGHNEDLRNVCSVLNALDLSVDRRCGLHVHVDVSDFNWEELQRLVSLWVRYEPFFYELTPRSRRTNQYCRPLRRSSWTENDLPMWRATQHLMSIRTEAEFRRYGPTGFGKMHSLNLQHFWMNGRVEFRLQGGTINYDKIRRWAQVLLALVQRVKAENAPRISCSLHQPRPELGFSTGYVFTILGLRPTKWAPEVPEDNRELERWASARRQQFAPANAQEEN
jgi:hypothetical protein